ncbi:hypothetical protein [uncultured Corynebacterium sp.]|uniref:hypothetical protein n=1 Tax=uncultured Corynebacterium sp. TaxID=159447 RepID=UPI0025D2FF43|nr:hypothetical protein [uncultured Corynebacterium sp.]
MKKFGIVLSVIGGIGLIVAILFGVFVGGSGMKQVVDTPKIEINGGSGTANLMVKSEYRLFRRGDTSGLPECTITSPSGEEIETQTTASSITLGDGEEGWITNSKIVSEEEGDYSFSCDRDVMVAKKEDIDKIGSGLLGVFGGIFGGMAAAFVLFVGVILGLVGRHRERQRIRETVNFVDDFSQQGRPDHPGGPGAMGGPGTPGGPGAPGGQGRPSSYWDQNPYGQQGPGSGPNQPPRR